MKELKEYEGVFVEKDTKDRGANIFYKGKELKQYDNHGYRRVYIGRKNLSVHRLVAMAFIKNPHNYPEVNHLNGVKCDNRVANLEWCTHLQNHQHADRTGLRKVREKHPSAKLNLGKVREIRSLYPKLSQYKLASKYGMSRSGIRNILNGRNWKS